MDYNHIYETKTAADMLLIYDFRFKCVLLGLCLAKNNTQDPIFL